MSDLAANIKEARDSLRPVEWSSARKEAVRRRIHGKQRRFTLSSVALGSAALAVAVAIAIVWFAQGSTAGLAPELAAVERAEIRPSAQIELADGTRAVKLGAASQVRLLHETEDLVRFSLESGKGWFEVTPSEKRRVEVQIQDVRVEVMGTEFVVEITGEVVHVWVQRGSVLVTSEGKKTIVKTGQHGEFAARNKAKDSNVISRDAGPEDEETPIIVPPAPKRGDEHSEPSKKNTKQPSDPAPPEEPTTNKDTPQEPVPAVKPLPEVDRVSLLWKRADQARLSGDRSKAISALTELLGKHEDDPRAALAAFSLGRVLVDDNRSPVVAARAFAKARKLAPAGPLVEDALLREIEAWFEAGDKRRVKKRSEKYFKLFPQGRYTKQVRDLVVAP